MTRNAENGSVATLDLTGGRPFRLKCRQCGQTGLFATRSGAISALWLPDFIGFVPVSVKSSDSKAYSSAIAAFWALCSECVARDVREVQAACGLTELK